MHDMYKSLYLLMGKSLTPPRSDLQPTTSQWHMHVLLVASLVFFFLNSTLLHKMDSTVQLLLVFDILAYYMEIRSWIPGMVRYHIFDPIFENFPISNYSDIDTDIRYRYSWYFNNTVFDSNSCKVRLYSNIYRACWKSNKNGYFKKFDNHLMFGL